MKRFVLIIILAQVLSVAASARNVDSLWNQAVADYTAGEYEAALKGFSEIGEQGYESPGLYFNIANCYYKLDHYLGKSILYYEKALKLDPSYEDARVNLDIAKERTLDRIEEVPDFILLTWLREFRDTMSSNAWAWTAIFLLVLTAVSVLLFRFAGPLSLRKTAFAVAVVAFCLMIVATVFAFGLRNVAENVNEAVVTVPVSSVKSSPSQTEQSLFILHEGTKVGIVDSLGDWYRIELADGRQGWMENDDMEII